MTALAVKRLTKNALRGPSSVLKWIANRSNGSPHHVWQKKLRTEVNFWDRWLATGGLTLAQEEFRKRTGVKTEVEPDIARFLRSKDDRILDVGAGPLTFIGSMWKGNRLDITAVDPLADEYNVLLDKHGILPPVRTRKVEAESLESHFPKNTFDFSFARNCLDCSYCPWVAIEQMLEVTKSGRYVVLVHRINAAKNELYRGMYQWNFHEENGDFLLSAPARETVNITKLLSGRAECGVEIEGDWIRFIAVKNYLPMATKEMIRVVPPTGVA